MWNKIKLARDVAVKSSWNEPPLWSVDHPLNSSWLGGVSGDEERIENNFEGYVEQVFKECSPVFACIVARQYVFSQARLAFRDLKDGTLSDGPELDLLRNPWPGGTTGELLAKMEQDASLSGNSWWTLTNDEGQYGNAAKGGTNVRLTRMRPDWVKMVIGSKSEDPFALDARIVGVVYQPRLTGIRATPHAPDVLLTIEEVMHYSPIPDPIARFRGLSWITPVLTEVEADKGASVHKKRFYDNAAVPNMVIVHDKDTNREEVEEFAEMMRGSHQGAWQAYKTLNLLGGADVRPMTTDFRNLDFSNVVGKGESRVASAAGVPPSWVGFSEGLQGSALNSGNMAANRRRFADGTIRPLWEIAMASLSVLVDVPEGKELWWDEADIAFLREDLKDLADIMQTTMSALETAIRTGFEPDAAVETLEDNGLHLRKLIGRHTGLVSVQMQPPLTDDGKQRELMEKAQLSVTVATVMATLTGAGYEEMSVRDAVDEATGAIDSSKLKKKPEPKVLPASNGQAKPAGSNGSKPKPANPAGSSAINPGGGGNGQQAARTS